MRSYYLLVLMLVIACDSKEKIEPEVSIVNNSPQNDILNDSIYKENLKSHISSFPLIDSDRAFFKNSPKDQNDIHLFHYKGIDRYYSASYTKAGLLYYDDFMRTNNQTSKTVFLKTADFIKKQAKKTNDYAVLQDNFIIEPHKFKSPSSSSVAQAYGIGVMLEAYSLTKNVEYLKMSEKFVNSFGIPIENGGVRSNWDGLPFYEEFADPNSHVLSGHLSSLIGLYYAYKITDNNIAKQYFDEGIETLKVKIRDFDVEFTSLYDKTSNEEAPYSYASAIGNDPDYFHELQISQLLLLYTWTEEEIFKNYAHRFLQQDMGSFKFLSNNSKFKEITSSHTIDSKNLGVSYLDDELWSWGKYWSSNKFPTELKIDFREEKKDITGISFFSIKEDTSPRNFKIFLLQNGNWNLISESAQMKMRNQNYYKTGNYETFIDTYYFPKKVDGESIKIKFIDSKSSDIIALREINVLFDRSNEIEEILKKIKDDKSLIYTNLDSE